LPARYIWKWTLRPQGRFTRTSTPTRSRRSLHSLPAGSACTQCRLGLQEPFPPPAGAVYKNLYFHTSGHMKNLPPEWVVFYFHSISTLDETFSLSFSYCC